MFSCLYIVTDLNASTSSRNIILKGVTAQSTVKEELLAAVPRMKGSMFCSNMMKWLELGTLFDNVSVYVDNTSAGHVAGNRTKSSRLKHEDMWYLFLGLK